MWIAHIQLIKTTDYKRVFQVKWQELLLLFLRLLMLASITLILTKPIFQSEVTKVIGEHHYISLDWLNTVSEQELIKLEDSTNTNNKFFILEDITKKLYKNIDELRERIAKDALDESIREFNQADFIAELEHRKEFPKVTHLYLTNRSNNYSFETLSATNMDSINIHLHELVDTNERKMLNIKLIYESENKLTTDLLVAALNALSADSNLVINIEVSNSIRDISKNEDWDIVFQVVDVVKNKRDSQSLGVDSGVNVIIQENGLLFESVNHNDIYWKHSEPVKLIGILSEFINSLKVISNLEVLSQESLLKNHFNRADHENKISLDNTQEVLVYSKSFNNYLIFLFCLFFLIERWLVFSRDNTDD